MRRDTIFCLASMTKSILAAAAMMLVEDGTLALGEPVDRLLELAPGQPRPKLGEQPDQLGMGPLAQLRSVEHLQALTHDGSSVGESYVCRKGDRRLSGQSIT